MRTTILLLIILFLSQMNICYSAYTWLKTNGPYGGTVNCFDSLKSGHIIAGTNNGIFRSSDQGGNWALLGLDGVEISDICFDSTGNIWANSPDGAYSSDDNGSNWDLRSTDQFVNGKEIAVNSQGNIFAMGRLQHTNQALYLSTDGGGTWTRKENAFQLMLSFVIMNNDDIFAGTYQDGIYKTTDGGSSWSKVGLDINSVSKIVDDDYGNIYAGTMENGFYISTDHGDTWNKSGLEGYYIRSIFVDDDETLCVGTNYNVFFKSTDGGNSWSSTNTGLNNPAVYDIYKLNNGIFFTGTETGGVYKSEDNCNNWYESNNGLDNVVIEDIVINQSNEVFAGVNGTGVWHSSDNGDNWTKSNNGLDLHVIELAINSTGIIYAGTFGNGIYRTTNSGLSWSKVKDCLGSSNSTRSIIIDEYDNVYAAINNQGIFYSSDNGDTWTNIGLTQISAINALSINQVGHIFAGTYSKGLYRTTDSGDTWNSLNCPATTVLSLMITKTGLVFAGATNGKIYRSLDNGDSWEERASLFYEVNDICESGEGMIYVGLNNNGPYQSPDQGELWGSYATGIGKKHVFSLFVNKDEVIFAGTANGVYKIEPGYKPLAAPGLISPGNNLRNIPVNYEFSWYKSRLAESYELMIATDEEFIDIVEFIEDIEENYYSVSGMVNNTEYYWRVRAFREDTLGGWSGAWNFRTKIFAPELTKPANNAINLSVDVELQWSQVAYASEYFLQIATGDVFPDSEIVYSGSAHSYTSHTITLEHDTKYYWRVMAIGDESQSDWSFIRNFAIAMEAPVLLAPADGSADLYSTVVFEWEAYGDVTYYTLEVAEDNDFKNIVFSDESILTESIGVSTLSYNTQYFWRVSVKFGEKLSYWSEVWNFRTGVEPPELDLPENNSMNLSMEITLKWKHKKIIDSYYAEIAQDEDFDSVVYKDTMILASAVYIDSLDYNTKYYWRVKGKVGDDWTLWSEVWNFSTGLEPPILIAPENNSINITTSSTFHWQVYDSSDSYTLEVATDSVFENMELSESRILDTFMSIAVLSYNTEYYWRVRAKVGEEESLWSETWNFRTEEALELGAPVLLSPAKDSIGIETTVLFQWEVTLEALLYHLQVSTDSGFTDIEYEEMGLENTEYQIVDLEFNTEYLWRVKARKDTLASDWSGVWNFTTKTESGINKDGIGGILSVEVVPNPFEDYANILFYLPLDLKVNIEIFDLAGGKVKTLISGDRIRGFHSVIWDGLDNQGIDVSSGTYYLRFIVDSKTITSPIILKK
ncbi:FlgD immunoglobulin-like domain containing protein [Bacteroidota bacterium]